LKNEIRTINSTLEKILKKYNLSDTYAIEYLKKNWSDIDKTIAIQSKPVAYNTDKKQLAIKVTGAQWKKEFIKNRKALIQKLKNTFTNIEIKDIEIT
jgi:hypothetical protein